ncbi:efflux RND transporter permease subunit [Rhizobium multihospitium]|uniref:Efflux pump membrane transporter n=1 Tax=Rhizobium multihospitium TaxID=410764 RepID=A0A1C3XDB9_9HYPH|nr:multidrug efflux RND transporter permease subunit [Rhizobium multihospitium]SCB50106.1 hydrophobe/amphiphile efflux-1 (HAE1) family protein [Rhizobium multihospitium]
MKLAHFFIDHPRFATVINIFFVLIGLAMLTSLPVAQYPNIVPPTVQITTAYPGASGETVARTVATPLEQAVNGVESMDYITSQSTGNGLLTITVIFKVGTDPNTALMLTRNRVQDTLSRLPQEVQLQGVQVKKTIPALLLGVHPYSPDGSRSAEYISNYFILHVKDEISRLPGVADLWNLGERQYAMRIWVDPDKAAASNITANEILSALRAQNAQVSAGTLNAPPVPSPGAYQISVEALGRLTTPEQFGDVIVKSDAQGRVTRIRDIARVELGAADYGSKAYADRYDSSPFWVIAQPGANVVQVEKAVWDKMEELKKSFPPGLDYINIYDPTTFVSQSIDEVVHTIFEAIVLVVVVVFVFLQNWRATIIPVLAIPISLVGTFTILAMFGVSINNLSLFGLVLAVGIVVDDAIVVVENVERNMQAGMSPREAAHQTMTDVSTALIAIALTLCAVFVPAAFISGIGGLFFKQFAITISASTVISCFVSLTLSPALCAVLLKPHPTGEHAKPRGLGRILHAVFGRFNHGFEWLSSSYGKMTARFVRVTAIIGLVYVALIGFTGFQMSRMPTGFIPEQDIGYLVTVIQLPPGSSLARTDEVVRQVNDIALGIKGIEHTSPVTGFDVTTNTVAPNAGTIFVALPSLYGKNIPGVNAAAMLKILREKLAVVKDAYVIAVMPPPVQGLGSAGGFKLMLEDRGGLGAQALAKAANDLVAAANKDPAFGGVFTLYNAGSPSLFADIDRLKAEKVGLTPTDVFSTLQLYIGSQYVNDFNYLGRTFQVIAQADGQFRGTPDDVARLKARNAAGEMVPIGSVATFRNETSPYRVPRHNLYPAGEIMGAAGAGISSGTAMTRMEELAKQVLPEGVGFEWTELSHQEKQQGTPTILVFAAAALFVFLVLAAQYESWKTPLSIVLILPMCLLTAAAGLQLRGMPIDILAQIGFVVLVGLAAKNAILIVEFARQEEHRGETPEQAAVGAAKTRLRPILMTSFAFILGVLPLATATGAGAEMRQSLGTAVFFGMLGVTIFGLLFTPAFYVLVQRFGTKKAATVNDEAPVSHTA